jgi:hypothetical protein
LEVFWPPGIRIEEIFAVLVMEVCEEVEKLQEKIEAL